MIKQKVAIIGLGLIGGSIGLAIKHKIDAQVIGFDINPNSATTALAMGAIDQAGSFPESVQQADLIFIATPISQVVKTMGKIMPWIKKDTIITDVASVKQSIISRISKLTRPDITFIGGHPMAGKEITGISGAESDLFVNRTWVLNPSLEVNPNHLKTLQDLIIELGAKPIILSANEHDRIVATVSHLPFVVSATLCSHATRKSDWPTTRKLAAGGFRDTTRLASGNPQLHTEITIANKHNLLSEIDSFILDLGKVRALIQKNSSAKLVNFFSNTKIARDQWLQETNI